MLNFFKLVCLALLLVFASKLIWGIRINSTNSIAKGLYVIDESEIEKGKYVMFCPPDNQIFNEARERGYIRFGYCDGGYMPLMKKVAAAGGDIVSINSGGVFINNQLYQLSKPIEYDAKGRELKPYRLVNYRLQQDEYLMMGDKIHNSYDGRYYGLIKKEKIKSVIKPILVED